MRISKRAWVMVCAIGLSVTAACGDDEKSGSGPAASAVGAEGGEVKAAGAGVEIPAGALGKDTNVGVAEVADPPAAPSGYTLAGPAIAFTPHGLSFEEAVTLTLPYTSSSEDLIILKLDDAEDTEWSTVEGGQFRSGVASIEVTSFSIYAVAEGNAANGSGGASGNGGNGGSGGGTDGGAANGGASGGSGGAATGNAADCAGTCERRLAIGCPNDPDQATCVSECEAFIASQRDSVCWVDFEILGTCAMADPANAYECDTDGKSGLKPDVCAAETTALLTCVTTGVNSRGEVNTTDGSVLGSCDRVTQSQHTCSDYYGSSYSALPIEDALCSGGGETFATGACDTTGAFGRCDVDLGGPGELIVHSYPADVNADAAAEAYCTQALGGVFTQL